MPLDEPDDERPEFVPPPLPDDRLWRHPSELAAARNGLPAGARAERHRPALDPARSRRRNLAASGVVLLGAAAVIGLVVIAGSLHDAPPVPTIALRPVTQPTAGASASITTVVAEAAAASAAGTAGAWLGVRGTDLAPQTTAVSLGGTTAASRGAMLVAVESGSPAEQSGLRSGDVVTAVDGHDLTSMADLMDEVHNHEPGNELAVTYTRSGQVRATVVTLGTAPELAEP